VRPPDVLIAGGGSTLFAVRGGDGELLFPDERGGQAFLREVWRRRAGSGMAGEAEDTTLRCDPLGCVYRARGRTVAFIRDSAALHEDCAKADVVVTWGPIRSGRCDGPSLRLDRRALAAGGGHALWLDAEASVRIEAVADSRGERPWSVRP
jgi:competence protein ComEC